MHAFITHRYRSSLSHFKYYNLSSQISSFQKPAAFTVCGYFSPEGTSDTVVSAGLVLPCLGGGHKIDYTKRNNSGQMYAFQSGEIYFMFRQRRSSDIKKLLTNHLNYVRRRDSALVPLTIRVDEGGSGGGRGRRGG